MGFPSHGNVQLKSHHHSEDTPLDWDSDEDSGDEAHPLQQALGKSFREPISQGFHVRSARMHQLPA